MNKNTVRAFAIGILFSSSLLGASFFFFQTEEVSETSVEEAREIIQNEGLLIITKDEYDQLTTVQEEKIQTPEKIEAETEQEEDLIETVIEIKHGMNVREVALILKHAQIIDHADDFEHQLITDGYSKKIQIGTFKLTNKMDYEEIAKIITAQQ